MMQSKFVYLFIFDFYILWICGNSFSIRYYIAEESKKGFLEDSKNFYLIANSNRWIITREELMEKEKYVTYSFMSFIFNMQTHMENICIKIRNLLINNTYTREVVVIIYMFKALFCIYFMNIN